MMDTTSSIIVQSFGKIAQCNRVRTSRCENVVFVFVFCFFGFFGFFLPAGLPRGPETLHDNRARCVHYNRCHSFFDPTHSFSYRVHGKIWPNLPTRSFSAITTV